MEEQKNILEGNGLFTENLSSGMITFDKDYADKSLEFIFIYMSKQDQRVYQKLIKSNAKIIKFANVNIFAWIINDAFFKQNRIVYLKQSLTQPKNKGTEK